METHNSYGHILIGLLIRFFISLSDLTNVAEVTAGLKALEKELKDSGFEVTLSGMVNLDDLKIVKADLSKKAENEPIGPEIQKRLIENMKSIEKIVYSEAQTRKIYTIPQRRYNGDYLLNRPSELLKPDAFNKLTEMAQYDFSSACRCLIFGESTACAFHILRATEDALKQYYFKYIKIKRLSTPMWGPMIKELKVKKNKKPDMVILNSLDLIRTSYRNPTQHPEVKYDIDSAQDLFGLCIDVLNKMT